MGNHITTAVCSIGHACQMSVNQLVRLGLRLPFPLALEDPEARDQWLRRIHTFAESSGMSAWDIAVLISMQPVSQVDPSSGRLQHGRSAYLPWGVGLISGNFVSVSI